MCRVIGNSSCLTVCRGLVTTEMDTKVQYRVHNSPFLISICSQTTRVHTFPSYFKTHFNIILSFTSIFFKWRIRGTLVGIASMGKISGVHSHR